MEIGLTTGQSCRSIMNTNTNTLKPTILIRCFLLKKRLQVATGYIKLFLSKTFSPFLLFSGKPISKNFAIHRNCTMARPGNKIIQAKLVLLGDTGTGKTSLVLRFVKGQFLDHQEPTIGAAFFTQILSLNEATVKFDIWDTAGQERYHSLAPMYYRGAAAAVVVYDISSMDTFARARKWVQELQRQGNPKLMMALVANKSDLDPKREIENEDGEKFAQENGMFFIETSAKTAQNVNELFYEIAKKLARACPPKPSGINLNNERQERGKLFCCLG